MKKIRTLTFLIMIISIGFVKSAPALMIDGSQIVAKISDYVQKITDAVNKISQQAMQIKLMQSQGFNFSGLIDLNGFLLGLQQSLVDQNADKQMQQVIEGTKQKNLEVAVAQKEAYGEAAQEQYSQKLAYTSDNIDKTQEKQIEYQNKAIEKCQQKEQARHDYENETNPVERSIKLEKYTNLAAECVDYITRAEETSSLLIQLTDEQNKLQEKAAIIGTDEDAEYHELKMREEALESQKEIVDFYGVESSSNTEWDEEDFAEGFQLADNDYKEFMERYFYNPQQISAKSGSETSSAAKRLDFQSSMDRVMRERRYLLVNSAAHLLQVSATIRREIPVRTVSIEKVFKNVPSSSGELEAMLSYAATRVENARALLLYAKLLSAKIQYMAAADLVGIEPKKIWKEDEDYSKFNLGRYILTEEYVKELVEEYNKTIDFRE